MNNNQTPTQKKQKSKFREYAEAILTAVLIALFIRSFGVEAFKIPSSSMVPTLLIGDHIFVNKFIYGLRIPLTKYRLIEFSKPKRGDVIVFMYPEDESKDFIKRAVGMPGDIVKIDGVDLFVNGEKVAQQPLKAATEADSGDYLDVEGGKSIKTIPRLYDWKQYNYFEEEIGESDFVVQYEKNIYHRNGEYEVPEGFVFVVGDNRDNSSDSREWGFVPMENIKGKAMFIWLSLDRSKGGIRFDRFGKWID